MIHPYYKTHAALEAGKTEVANAHQRRESDGDVDHFLLPSFDHDAKEEEGQRYFEDQHCEDVEDFCCYKPLWNCQLFLFEHLTNDHTLNAGVRSVVFKKLSPTVR